MTALFYEKNQYFKTDIHRSVDISLYQAGTGVAMKDTGKKICQTGFY